MAKRIFLCTSLLSIMGALSACDGSQGASTTISIPTAINLYPVKSTTTPVESPARLFVMVKAVGTLPVTLPLAFDTGSSGITLDALSFLPGSLVTPNGFTFPQGQSHIVYQGITVTDQQGTRSYGNAGGRTEIGNIGYATVTFGDGADTLTTRQMPVFLYYAVHLNTNSQPASPQVQQGWFGVNDAGNPIKIAGTTEPSGGYPECTLGVTGTCYVASVLKYLDYGSGIDAGFSLTPAPLQSCDIDTPGSCMPAPLLAVGLTSSILAGFTPTPLNCTPASGYSGPAQIQSYPLCQDGIPGTTLSASGDFFTGTVLFDSGTPFIQVYVPPNDTFPTSIAAPDTLTVTTPGGFEYAVTAGTGIDAVNVSPNSNSQNIVGIGYFTTNSFFIDFSNSTEGWK